MDKQEIDYLQHQWKTYIKRGRGIYFPPEKCQTIKDFADEVAGYYHISTNEVMGNPIWYIKKYISEIFGATHPKEDKNENRR